MSKLKVVLSEDLNRVAKIREQLIKNNGYCPCRLQQTKETRCMCKEFRDQVKQGISGECHCGLYKAVK